MTYTFIVDRCGDLPTSVVCKTMGVSTSAFYAWRADPVCARDLADAVLTNACFDIHRSSRRSYGSPRVHAELRLGDRQLRCGRKRVERLMRQAGIVGLHRRRGRGGCTRSDGTASSDDLVNRDFAVDAIDRLWVMDVERHEALSDRAVVKGHRCQPVVAGW